MCPQIQAHLEGHVLLAYSIKTHHLHNRNQVQYSTKKIHFRLSRGFLSKIPFEKVIGGSLANPTPMPTLIDSLQFCRLSVLELKPSAQLIFSIIK